MFISWSHAGDNDNESKTFLAATRSSTMKISPVPANCVSGHLAPDTRSLINDHRHQTTDHRPRTTGHRPRTTDYRPPATDSRPPTPDFPTSDSPIIQVRDLTLAYGAKVIMRDLSFDVHKGEVLVIIGGSGSGKSTLLKALIGLFPPAAGKILYGTTDYWSAGPAEQSGIRRRMGVLYQHGALWSSMNLAENIALPLEVFTGLKQAQVKDLVSFKLSLVGLAGQENAYPSELSGGMRKRAALARAMALDPEILFFDEPSSGLDPVSSRRLDELILELQSSLGTTMIVVTHDLDSIFSIGSRALFLDASTKTMAAIGPPRELRDTSDNPAVREFLNRGRGEESGQWSGREGEEERSDVRGQWPGREGREGSVICGW